MPRTPFTERIHIPVRPGQKARLDRLARQRDVPRAQLAREALTQYLERQSSAQPPHEPAA